jgi:octaprenyl-diphosphate synthase
VKDHGGIEYTQKMMKQYSQEALDILYEFPENEFRNSLETMVKYVIEREK